MTIYPVLQTVVYIDIVEKRPVAGPLCIDPHKLDFLVQLMGVTTLPRCLLSCQHKPNFAFHFHENIYKVYNYLT